MERLNSTKKSNAPSGKTDAQTLDLPDWSGMDTSTRRMTTEAAFALCEEYQRRYPAEHQRVEQREKCLVEFVL